MDVGGEMISGSDASFEEDEVKWGFLVFLVFIHSFVV
jgi:hypothetical protein